VALAQEFYANVLGFNMAFILNVVPTHNLGKESKWAWRVPIIAMQIYPIKLFAVIAQLPETPRWHIFHEQDDNAEKGIATVLVKAKLRTDSKSSQKLMIRRWKKIPRGGTCYGPPAANSILQ
jgi:hypothetical protein